MEEEIKQILDDKVTLGMDPPYQPVYIETDIAAKEIAQHFSAFIGWLEFEQIRFHNIDNDHTFWTVDWQYEKEEQFTIDQVYDYYKVNVLKK
jgi:hypothetical protein